MKLTDYTYYSQCIENSSLYDLEELSKNKDIEERFLKFLKYIEILDAKDPKKVEGEKLIKIIFNTDKFKAYQNMSLQLFDQESVIREEEPVEENTHKVQLA